MKYSCICNEKVVAEFDSFVNEYYEVARTVGTHVVRDNKQNRILNGCDIALRVSIEKIHENEDIII